MIAGLITMFVFSSVSSAVANPAAGRIENREGSVFIETPYITVKLNEGKPDFFIWETNSTDTGRRLAMFHISFTSIAELFGDDLIVDDRTEFLGGKI